MHPTIPTIALLGGTAEQRDALANRLQAHAAQAGTRLAIVRQTVPGTSPQGAPIAHLLLHPSADSAYWRALMTERGCSYSVLYGSDEAQSVAAWALAAPLMGLSAAQGATSDLAGPPARTERATRLGSVWRCDKCSDPACEHRLFRDLLARREDAAG